MYGQSCTLQTLGRETLGPADYPRMIQQHLALWLGNRANCYWSHAAWTANRDGGTTSFIAFSAPSDFPPTLSTINRNAPPDRQTPFASSALHGILTLPRSTMEAPTTRPSHPPVWRDGGLRRVALGSLSGFAGGALYATSRALPPASVFRGALACSFFATPFFALREVVAAGLHVDGPVASTVAGGVAGYVGALLVSGPHWKTVSHSAMAVGVGCGLVDIVVSRLDWQRKAFLVNRHDAAVAAAAEAAERKDITGTVERPNSWFKLPSWFPGLKEIDEEYQDLLRRQEATVLALEQEQARIAVLLEALERVKGRRQILDPERAETHLKDGLDD